MLASDWNEWNIAGLEAQTVQKLIVPWLVGGLEPWNCMISHILGRIIHIFPYFSIFFHIFGTCFYILELTNSIIFQRGRSTTQQKICAMRFSYGSSATMMGQCGGLVSCALQNSPNSGEFGTCWFNVFPWIQYWLVVWNHGTLWLSIIPSDFHSMIFQRGRSTTNQIKFHEVPMTFHHFPYCQKVNGA